jgi:hypothetical protein
MLKGKYCKSEVEELAINRGKVNFRAETLAEIDIGGAVSLYSVT